MKWIAIAMLVFIAGIMLLGCGGTGDAANQAGETYDTYEGK